MREYRVASTNVFNMDETGFIMNRECLVWVLESGSFVIVPIGDLAHPPSRLLLRVRSSGELPGVVSGMAPRTTVSFFRDMNGIPASWHFSNSDSGRVNSEASLLSNGWKICSNPAHGRRRHRIGVCSSLTAIGHTQVRRLAMCCGRTVSFHTCCHHTPRM